MADPYLLHLIRVIGWHFSFSKHSATFSLKHFSAQRRSNTSTSRLPRIVASLNIRWHSTSTSTYLVGLPYLCFFVFSMAIIYKTWTNRWNCSPCVPTVDARPCPTSSSLRACGRVLRGIATTPRSRQHTRPLCH